MSQLSSSKLHLSPRQDRIIDRARRDGFVSVEGLAVDFDVTPQTIRRDLNLLCDHALLRRHHGGAALPSSVENVSYDARQVMNQGEKRSLARALADFIPDRASLFINIGTTTEEVAKALLGHRELRVITNNLNVASILAANPDFEVIIAGGYVRNRDRGVIGEATIDFINQFKVDIAVIGISGIDEDGALLDYDYREVRVAQTIIKNAREVLLVADHTKFERRPMVRLGDASVIDHIFTDQPLSPEMEEIFKSANVSVHISDILGNRPG